jgi:GT2 family glycosyltransferase
MPSVSPTVRPPAACTIVSRNYLSHARVLAASYLRQHPGARFYLLVVDGVPEGTEVEAGVRVLGPDDLALPYFYELCFAYDVSELCTAVKPGLLQVLLNRYGEEEVLYIDPDIMVMRPLEELRAPLAAASIVLTPAMLRPMPRDGKRPIDQDILIAGAYNLGFLGVRRSEQTQEFLRWWEQHLREGGAVVDVPKGLMTDQKWVDLVPSLFSETVILRDDTYNVAWWNLHHREVTRRGDEFLVNGRPLAFFHFSGFDPAKPRVFTKECQNRVEVVEGTALAELIDLYVGEHRARGHGQSRGWEYGFARFDSGVPVNLPLRRLYLDLDEEARARFGDPFRTQGPNSFLAWATRPRPEDAYLSPFLLSVHQVRYDVAAAYPDVRGRDRAEFLEWARTSGPGELKYDPAVMRVADALAGAAANGDANGSGDLVSAEHLRYRQLLGRLRELVPTAVQAEATVLVASKGDDDLLKAVCRNAWHFPRTPDGEYAGHNPSDSAEAIGHLEELRTRGAGYLLLPATALWWLEHYAEFKDHLARHYRVALDRKDVGRLFALDRPKVAQPAPTQSVAPAAAPARDTAAPRCSIIIPVYNKASLTGQCLDVLLDQSPAGVSHEVIVVDDHSTDQTAEVLGGYGGRVRVVRHETNRGFATSCNDGAAAAAGEFVVFLNNDTIPQPGWLDALVDYADRHPRAAVVGSKLLFPDDTVQHAGIVFDQLHMPRHIYAGFPGDHPAVNKSRRFQTVTGACILVRRAAFEEVGGFDPAFLNSYEDTDLCLKLGERGYEVHYCHESVLYHLESVTRDVRLKQEEDNAELYQQRWASRVRQDDLPYYVEDGLLSVEYRTLYPIAVSLSPLLAMVNRTDRDSRADRLLEARTLQVLGLLKDNIRLNVRVQEAEFRAAAVSCNGDSPPERRSGARDRGNSRR